VTLTSQQTHQNQLCVLILRETYSDCKVVLERNLMYGIASGGKGKTMEVTPSSFPLNLS
jgi:hypothetical protein